jgi:TonB family protein
MRKLILITAATLCVVGCSKTPAPESIPKIPDTLSEIPEMSTAKSDTLSETRNMLSVTSDTLSGKSGGNTYKTTAIGDSDGSLKLKKKKNNTNRSGVDDLLDELARETYNLTGKDIRFRSRDEYSNCLRTSFNRVAKGTRNIGTITRMVMENKAALCYAYRKRLREKPGLTGVVYVNFTIDEFGNVTSAQLVKSTVSDLELENTVVSRVKSWKFEKIDQSGDVTDVTYRFVFSE